MASEPSTRTVARSTLVVIGLLLATALILLIGYETRRVLIWIAIAGFFATALHPAVSWLERRIRFTGRWLPTLLVFIVVFALLGGLVALFVVPLVREGTRFAHQVPQLVNDIQAGRGPVGRLAERWHVIDWVKQHEDQIKGYAGGLGGHTVAVVQGVATTLAGILAIIVLAYLMVLEGPRAVDAALGLVGPGTGERIRKVGSDCARTITGYITGNLLISVICGVLTWVVLLILRVPFAGLIALFVAIADLIPLVGATLGAVIAALAGFVHSLTAGIVLIIFFVVYQQLENHLLQPLIFSRTVQLNPLTVLIAILLGVELAGILGALMAIPVAGICQIIARDLLRQRRFRLAGPGGLLTDPAEPPGTAIDAIDPDQPNADEPNADELADGPTMDPPDRHGDEPTRA